MKGPGGLPERGSAGEAPAVAAYVRVSSRSQGHATQVAAIDRAASARGEAVRLWFAERRSARTTDREVLRELLGAARTGAFRRLYVFRLDRLTRTGIADTLRVLEELRAAGVQVVTVSDGFDPSGPFAEVIVAVMAWAAKMERLAIAERIAAARDRVEAEGGRWGRPSRVDRATRAQAVELAAAGESVRAIARRLKVPRSTIQRAIAVGK